MKTKIAINGACGRMGQRLIALAKEDTRSSNHCCSSIGRNTRTRAKMLAT